MKGVDSNILNMATGALSVTSDVEAFVVPVWAIWQLNIELRQKMAVLVVFGMGAMWVSRTVWNAEHLLNRFSAGLYYRVILMEQSDYTWLLSQTALVW